jgi:hypothetical protein
MGCCLFAIILAGAPRFALFFWYLLDTRYVNAAFNNLLFAILGFLFLPWTTLMWVIVYPGGISLVNWIFLGIAFLIDMGTYFGGGREGQRRYAS